MDVDNVVWDMDGTLVDSSRVVPDAFIRAVAALHGPAITAGEVVTAKGLPIAVFTGASMRSAQILLAAAGINADVIIGGDQIERPKPAADGMLLAAQRLDTTPDRLVLIGDSPLDLQAAKAAGSVSASAAWGHLYDPAQPADITLSTRADARPFRVLSQEHGTCPTLHPLSLPPEHLVHQELPVPGL